MPSAAIQGVTVAHGQPWHPSEEALERYVLRRGPVEEPVQEHLLWCAACQERAEAMARFAGAMRREATVRPARATQGRWGWLVPLAAAGALGGAVVVWQGTRAANEPAPEVVLTAMRGEREAASMTQAGQRWRLRLRATEAVAGRRYGIAVVDAQGQPVWTGTVVAEAGTVPVVVDARLGAGQYWVRLDADGELLHEYALTAQ